jgi:phytanoyl-CoA hydroxylase
MRTDALTADERAQYDEAGFVLLRGAVDAATCAAVLDGALAAARGEAEAGLVLPEANLADGDGPVEDRVSKVFGLHRHGVFADVAGDPGLTGMVAEVVGPRLDCFLSQFVFKAPGAWGQPWHQDAYYFDFDRPRPVAGVSLAVTEATVENGCLWVVPGTHAEDVHEHVPDRRPGANVGYVEVAGRDMGAAEPVPMHAGDVLLFDSHLIHRSGDNVTADQRRGAMTYHFCATGTVDRGPGYVTDFVTVR